MGRILIVILLLVTALVISCCPAPPPLFLEVAAPEDESIVDTSTISVSGTTIPGAVVSVLVNDEIEIADVDEQGNFSVTVELEEGPNIIEVIASDLEGNEEHCILVVIYTP